MNDMFSITSIFSKKLHEVINGAPVEEAVKRVNERITVGEMKGLLDGEYSPNIIAICDIADAYGVTTDYLLGRAEEKETATVKQSHAAQLTEVINNFTNFPPVLQEFAHQYFGDIEVESIHARHAKGKIDPVIKAEIDFVGKDGETYRICVERIS